MAGTLFSKSSDGQWQRLGIAKGVVLTHPSGAKTYLDDPAECFDCSLTAQDKALLQGMHIEAKEP